MQHSLRLIHTASLAGLVLALMLFSGCAVTGQRVADPPADTSAHAAASQMIMRAPLEVLPVDRPLTLDEVLDRVARANPELQALHRRAAGAAQRPDQVAALPDPMLTAERNDVMTAEWELMLEQEAPWPGMPATRRREAEAMARAASAETLNRALELQRNARRTYHELAHEHALFELSQAELQLAVQTLRISAAAYTSGRLGRLAVVRAQSEIARIEGELTTYPARIAALEARLARLMGTELPAMIAEAPQLPAPEIAEPGALPDAPYDEAFHPMVQMRVHEWQARGEGVEMARLEQFPMLRAGVRLMREESGGDDGWGALLGVSLPLPNARRVALRIEAAEARAEALAQVQAARAALREEAAVALAMARASLKQYELTRDAILPLAEEAWQVAATEYQSGRGSFLEMLDAERALVVTRREIIMLRRAALLAIADYQYAMAGSLSSSSSP